jgi:dTDP-4-amino-4,6-dideoxygalactose transaminase
MTTQIESQPMPRSATARTRPNERPSALAFPTWPAFAGDELEAAERVLRSGKLNYWTGSEGREFEREFAEYVNCRHAVAVANGTAALELALEALGIGAGDEVVVPSRTFVATASAVCRCGATPVFADVDRDSQNITADSLRAVLTSRTKAVIVVHLAGWPCEMESILDVACERDLRVIEDCAQAHGARYRGRAVGSLGDVAAFSFCQDKIMTTAGEGGMLVTNCREIWHRAWSFKDHGKNYAAALAPAGPAGFRWLHDSIGTNLRLTEIQSAIGRVALRKLDGWVGQRRRNADILHERLSPLPAIRTASPPADMYHSHYKWYAFVRPERLASGWSRDRILGEINRHGVPCFSGSCSEIYLEKAFEPELRPVARHTVARELGETSLMLLVHPTLTDGHVRRAADIVRTVIEEATRPGHDDARPRVSA